jgi:hypothetical protein
LEATTADCAFMSLFDFSRLNSLGVVDDGQQFVAG